jgi:hypothetical protein
MKTPSRHLGKLRAFLASSLSLRSVADELKVDIKLITGLPLFMEASRSKTRMSRKGPVVNLLWALRFVRRK